MARRKGRPFWGQNLEQMRQDTVRDGTSLDRATTDAQTFDHKRHEAAYETPQPIIREAAQEKAPDTGRKRPHLGYEEDTVVRSRPLLYPW